MTRARAAQFFGRGMHELGLMQGLVEAVSERVGRTRVSRITLEVGQLSLVLPDSLRFCFDVCAQGTPLEGAQLEIVDIAGKGRCRACGSDVVMHELITECGCGCIDLQVVAGQELRLKEVEVV